MQTNTRRAPLKVLLVDDSPSDVLLTREAFAQTARHHELYVVPDGVEALAFLRHAASYAETPRPDLILLDWHLPRKDGCEVLAEIKTDVTLQTIPVVVMSTSQETCDIHTAYRLHANCYIAKPDNFCQLTEIVKSLEYFWGAIAALPAL